jgi:hypothetical protein
VGFEPTNGGFADLSLGPLGYRAKQSSIANPARASVRAGRPFAQIGEAISFRQVTLLSPRAETVLLLPAASD